MTDGDPAKRQPSGRFSPGQSGNPSGRPKSESTELRQALATKGKDVTDVVLKLALGGNLDACRLVLDRLVPPLKATAQAVNLPLTNPSSPLETARDIIRATADGAISPDIAAALVAAVGKLVSIEEVEDLRKRLAAIEKAISSRP